MRQAVLDIHGLPLAIHMAVVVELVDISAELAEAATEPIHQVTQVLQMG